MLTLSKYRPLGAPLVGVKRNLWRTQQGLVSRMNFPIDGLVLYAPLWHPELSGSPFLSKDLNAHTCTVTGATWGLQGRTFNGTSGLLSIAYNAVFNLGNSNFTLMFWMYRNSNGAGEEVIGTRTSGALAEGFILSFNTDVSYLQLYMDSGAGTWDLAVGRFAEPVADKTWTQIIMERSGANLNLYQNLVANADTINLGTSSIGNPGGGIFLGACGDSSRFWKGSIGEVSLVKRAFSSSERQHSYNVSRWRYA